MTYDFENLRKNSEIQKIGYKAAGRFKKQLSKEEIDSCFLTALWKACENYNPDYDPKKIASFYTFLYKGVTFECMKLCKKNNTYKNNLNKIKNRNNSKIKSSYNEKFFSDFDAKDFGLNDIESQILIERFWENKTLKEISKKNNVSPQAIRKRIAKILLKLKDYCV